MRRKVLVADDDPELQALLARALERETYEVIGACDGEQALAAVARERPDLVLLDLDMPRKSGWDVLGALRHGLETRTLPVIIVSGMTGPRDRLEGLRLGADDYIAKPFDVEELKARLAGLLRRCEADLSASPLTRLPGSPAIEREVQRRLDARESFAFSYADLDHFKAYNDVYGFERGDAVLRETARLLVECARSACADAFVGHIGGDDFVAIVAEAEGPLLAQRLVSRFDEAAPAFYEPGDRARKALRARDREGRWREFPLLSLSIGVAVAGAGGLDRYDRIVRVASEMKSWCKAQPEQGASRFAVDRRGRYRSDR